ncbi:hypothetical protein [Tahibacter amnicola]|uniref:Uncharacterized protein n=1 Tax=Tahibacter amnicola TaxID=2976241 RepID=A0ABY6BJW0_9GAMM|nr:hypothetical protein [Tahibacter amnicola]UXI70298.1 hypothetical protein N4264_11875 [Tahibacter amnicola]
MKSHWIAHTLTLGIALSFATTPALAAGVTRDVETTESFSLKSGTKESREAYAWIAVRMANTPLKHAAAPDSGDLEITHIWRNSAEGATPPDPPHALPLTGTEGESITFKRRVPRIDGGGLETWIYQWHSTRGGAWQLVDYHFTLGGNCDNGP